MARTHHSVLLALLLSPLAAQSYVSPAHFASWPGDLSTPYPFSYNTTAATTLRLQQIHEDLQGGVKVFNSLAFRRASVLGTTLPAAIPVKTMTLKLTLGPSVAAAAATTAWPNNYTATGTQVFAGQLVTLPTWNVGPRSAPAPFELVVVFQTPYVYAGTGPFLWDCDVLTATTQDRVNLDQAQSGFPLFSWCAYDMLGVGCSTAGVEMELRGTGQTVLAPVNQFSILASTIKGPASAAGALLVGVQQTATPLPGLCTLVYVNPLFTLGGTTDAAGTWSPLIVVPYKAAYVGLPLIMQSAVSDASRPIPLSASNGLSYRGAPPQPSFAISMVQGTTGSAAATSALVGRGTVVKLN